jgi:hypothetical protein
MGNGGSSGGCPYTNQGEAIDREKNNIYRLLDDMRNRMNFIDGKNIFNLRNQVNGLNSMTTQISSLYQKATSLEKIRDDTADLWEGNLKTAINNLSSAEKKRYYNDLLMSENKAQYYTNLQSMADKKDAYEEKLSQNNSFQQTINQYTKSYYDLIFGQNSKLSNRKNDTQYTDFFSTDGQKTEYVSNDNEYLRALNYVFLIVYYILAIIVLYIIYTLNMTNFSKIVMAVIILLYPLLIYSIQHTLHYLWVNFNTTP